MREINTETYLKKKKMKRQNMEKTDSIMCLKKKNKDQKNIKKINVKLKGLNIAINKIVF